ncbi:Thiol-disulfide oxidoreductase ResA [Burkholderiales bacterium]|nr:Thiol-disulfide oxidoreductase ResA [Burkholderiales bacterium]
MPIRETIKAWPCGPSVAWCQLRFFVHRAREIWRRLPQGRLPWPRAAGPALVCASLLLTACGDREAGHAVGPEPAPLFVLELFQGGSFSLAEQRGKVVVINFFASWCISCGEESPMIERVAKEYQPKGVAFLAVAVDDTEQKARAYLQKAGLNIPAGLDGSGKIKEAFGIYGMPTTFFIDRAGRITYMHAGAIGEQLMRHEIDKLLQAQ